MCTGTKNHFFYNSIQFKPKHNSYCNIAILQYTSCTKRRQTENDHIRLSRQLLLQCGFRRVWNRWLDISLLQASSRGARLRFDGRRVTWIRARSNAGLGSIIWTRPPADAAAEGGVVCDLTAVGLSEEHGASELFDCLTQQLKTW